VLRLRVRLHEGRLHVLRLPGRNAVLLRLLLLKSPPIDYGSTLI